MGAERLPVWQFFQIPQDAIDHCHLLANKYESGSEQYAYWKRAAEFLQSVKSKSVDQLSERDFDWVLQLRVELEHEE